MSDAPQTPPIPTVPILGGNGRINPEWWRWFARVGRVEAAQQQSIVTINQTIDGGATIDATGQTMLSLLAPKPVPVAELEALPIPADPMGDFAIERFVRAPSEAVDEDQIAMRAMMMSVPA